MPNVENLIASLAQDLKPVDPRQGERIMLRAVGLGAFVALLMVLGVFGVQPGLGTIKHIAPFVMKATYALTIGVIAFALSRALARPGFLVAKTWRWLVVPIGGLAMLSAYELVKIPRADWARVIMGHTWTLCPFRVVVIAVPVFLGMSFAIRKQAPTNLRAAGAAAGLLSGALAASIYALACNETSAMFVLLWYSLGMTLSTLIGTLIGPQIFRW